jgi:hypothetical protein
LAFLSGLFGGNASGANAAASAAPYQLIGAQQALGSLNSNYANAKKEFDTNYYQPYTDTGTSANTMYAKALGLNGPSGNADATNAYQANPGYQWQMDQGTQALERSAAGSGLFGSGNAAIALTKYGEGLANQDYGNWLSRLQGVGAQGLTAAAGQTGRQGALAGIDTGLGNAQAGVWNDLTKGVTGNYINGQQQDAASNAQGSANFINALLGGANLGISALNPSSRTPRQYGY